VLRVSATDPIWQQSRLDQIRLVQMLPG